MLRVTVFWWTQSHPREVQISEPEAGEEPSPKKKYHCWASTQLLAEELCIFHCLNFHKSNKQPRFCCLLCLLLGGRGEHSKVPAPTVCSEEERCFCLNRRAMDECLERMGIGTPRHSKVSWVSQGQAQHAFTQLCATSLPQNSQPSFCRKGTHIIMQLWDITTFVWLDAGGLWKGTRSA